MKAAGLNDFGPISRDQETRISPKGIDLTLCLGRENVDVLLTGIQGKDICVVWSFLKLAFFQGRVDCFCGKINESRVPLWWVVRFHAKFGGVPHLSGLVHDQERVLAFIEPAKDYDPARGSLPGDISPDSPVRRVK